MGSSTGWHVGVARSVFFLDQNRGWVVGSKGTLLATEDGGRSWLTKPRPSADVLLDVFFADELTGWVVCERNIYDLKTKTDPRTYLMSTTDGGEHWNRIAIRGADVDARLVRAFFRPSGRGWTFGEGGVIYTSSDSGASSGQVAVAYTPPLTRRRFSQR